MFYYFGYGSNLSETALRAKGVRPLSSEPAILAGWELCFDIPNFFPIEGGTGNIRQRDGAEVHGVLYGCNDPDLTRLDELEALNVAYLRKTMAVRTYGGEDHHANVYVGISTITADGLFPSRRYLNILVQGAEDMHLDPDYVRRLRQTEVCMRPRYGPFRFPSTSERVFSLDDLAAHSQFTAIAGAVFDMSRARHEHQYLKQLLGGRDVTLFFLGRMDTSDNTETRADIERGFLSASQRDYLNDYLHQFNREYSYVGKMDYAATLHRVVDSSLCPAPAVEQKEIASRRVLRTAEHTNRILGHENLGFLSETHGFMPICDPYRELPSHFSAWDSAVSELTSCYRELQVRKVLDELAILSANERDLPDRYLLRASAVLSMLAHAYCYCETSPPAGLPDSITRPWAEVRRRLDRPDPVLSYIDLIVYNWKVVDEKRADQLVADNLKLLVPTVNNQEERVFYLTQTEILARASPIIGAIVRAQEGAARDEPKLVQKALQTIIESLQRIVRESLLNINPNPASSSYVNPVVWAKTVAPFAVPLQAGIQGPSGTSSPIFNLLDIFLGRKKNETFLGREIRQLRAGYPFFWREFLSAVGEVSVTEYVARVNQPSLSGLLKDVVEVYAGDNGFLGRHRMKVYGYLEQAFKVGRSVTIGGFAGAFVDRTWDQVDSELEYSRVERLESFPQGCHHGKIQSVGQTHGNAAEGVKHVVLDISGSGVRYQPGDRCGILPENSDELIELTLESLAATGDEMMSLTPEWLAAIRLRSGHEADTALPLREFLRFARVRPVVPRVAEALHAATQSATLLTAILQQKTARWELWDLLRTLAAEGYDPTRLWKAPPESAEHICRVVPPETFRMYSIASNHDSPGREAAKEIELTVGRVRYLDVVDHGDAGGVPVERLGTASNFLAQAAGRESPISFIIDHPPRFSLPHDTSIPIVMLAGGTGISPFRSFILERIRQNAGKCYLFLSLRSQENFHYQDELLHGVASGILELDVAFSREDVGHQVEQGEQGLQFAKFERPRRQIHDLLQDEKNSTLLRRLLGSRADGGEGAYVYICGRGRFARSVHEAFHALLMKFNLGEEEERRLRADEVIEKMVAEGRFMQEIFTDAQTWDIERKQIDCSEIIKHNDPSHGYWFVIDGLVYDISEFIRQHPGGSHVLRGYAGMDASLGYQRAHKNRSEIDAMREMYEIGQVRQLALGGVARSIDRGGKQQSMALSSLHRAWLQMTYLVVEMQNAFVNDASLQAEKTTNLEGAEERTAYKLQRAIETHERFKRNYFDGILAEPATSLWLLTRGMCSFYGLSPSWLSDRMEEISEAPATKLARSLAPALYRRLDRLVAGPNSADEDWLLLQATIERMFDANRRFLERVKMLLSEGLTLFEENEAKTLDIAEGRLVKLLASLPDLAEEYYRSLGEHFARGGWQQSEFPPPASSRRTSELANFKSLISTDYWFMEEDVKQRIVHLTRYAVPVDSIDDLRAQNAEIIEQFRQVKDDYGIVVDMRQAPSRNDPEFEDAMRHLRLEIGKHYRRVAVLVTSAMGVLQVNRIDRNEGGETFATQSESAARRFAAGH